MPKCPFCHHTGTQCGEVGPKGMHCTKEADHDGQHVACGYQEGHDMDRWKQLTEEKEDETHSAAHNARQQLMERQMDGKIQLS